MMKKDTRADAFFDIVKSNYGLFRWEYDSFGSLLDSTCHWPELYEKFFVFTGCKNYMMDFMAGHRTPLILSTYLGMEWASVRAEDDRIYVLGPAMQSDVTDELILQTLNAFSNTITAGFSGDFITLIHTLPVIALTSLQNLTLMMAYALTEVQYQVSDIHYRNENSSNTGQYRSDDITPREQPDMNALDMDELHQILHVLVNGDLKTDIFLDRSFIDRIRNSLQLSDTLPGFKASVYFWGTLCSQSAIRGGLLPETAHVLLGLYMQNTGSCRSVDEAITVAQTVYSDFRNRVSKIKTVPGTSREIRECCQYILSHPTEKLTVPQLAARFGYTDYYFSRKFHEETGEHLLSYIRRTKMDTAAFFLANSAMSIQEISDTLLFSNRNVFTSAFCRQFGCSPAVYRREYDASNEIVHRKSGTDLIHSAQPEE